MRSKHIINKILVSFVTVVSIIAGQTFEISGIIKDESGKKVSNARLTLYSSKYQLVKTERTKGNGKFKFKKIAPDKYTLNIYGAGGNSATKEIDLRSQSISKLEVTTGQDDKQPQLNVESEVGNVILKWEPINNSGEYIIFRDNTELTKTSKPSYKDKVIGGKSYAYNITAVDNNGEKGTRSLTEHGKALLQSPANIKALAKKNTISLAWDEVQNANSYNIYRIIIMNWITVY